MNDNLRMTNLFIKIGLILLFSTCITNPSHAQKQLVLLKGEKVLLNLKPGDDISFRVKGQKEIRTTYINNLSDTALVTHKDTVAFRMIDRVYFKQSNLVNVVGTVLVIGGAGYFIIDQFNNVVVNKNDARFEESVTRASATMLAIGLPMMLIRKKSEKLGHGRRLMMVTEKSPFYRKEIKHTF